ncbi:MAG: ATP-dependent helicase HrpA, partial [Actinomycetota bacterium]|nr:ATP-dependent helicase HrpA [Actinomycetota bacterium]
KFRRLCKAEYLNYLRVREWQDLDSQLRRVVRVLGVRLNDVPGERAAVTQSLLAGLLSHIGVKDVETREYNGARGARFAVFPGSALFRKQPRWVMAAELVETTRLWGRVVGRIEPEWAEALAGHLVKRSYSEPHWEAKRGSVVAYEKVTLYGVPLVSARKIGYGRIDPPLARELFIRHALVEGDWTTHHAFFQRNQQLLADAEELEQRSRRRDIVVDDEILFAFYDQRLSPDVVSARHFDSWWKKARKRDPDLLTFTPDMLVDGRVRPVVEEEYPSVWEQHDLRLPVSYRFEPGDEADGVRVQIPVEVLNRISADEFGWQVPGFRLELVTALLKSLPKHLRRNFVPAPDVATAVVGRLPPARGSLPEVLADELFQLSGVEVHADDFDLSRVPAYLRVGFEVVDGDGEVIGVGKDLADLSARLTPAMRAVIADVVSDIERTGLTSWDFDALPQTAEQTRDGLLVRGFPALVDEGSSVALRVLETAALARASTWAATRRLLLLNTASPAKLLQRQLDNDTKLALSRNAPGGVPSLLDDCLMCALDEFIAATGGPPTDREGFAKLLERVRLDLGATLTTIVTDVVAALSAAEDVGKRLRGPAVPSQLPALVDMKTQLTSLVHPGFVSEAGARRLPDLTRYLRAIERRLDKVADDVNRDRARMWEVEQATHAYAELVDRLSSGDLDDDVRDIRWMIEELRVSLFAQTLGTPRPVSLQRILRAIDKLSVSAPVS